MKRLSTHVNMIEANFESEGLETHPHVLPHFDAIKACAEALGLQEGPRPMGYQGSLGTAVHVGATHCYPHLGARQFCLAIAANDLENTTVNIASLLKNQLGTTVLLSPSYQFLGNNDGAIITFAASELLNPSETLFTRAHVAPGAANGWSTQPADLLNSLTAQHCALGCWVLLLPGTASDAEKKPTADQGLPAAANSSRILGSPRDCTTQIQSFYLVSEAWDSLNSEAAALGAPFSCVLLVADAFAGIAKTVLMLGLASNTGVPDLGIAAAQLVIKIAASCPDALAGLTKVNTPPDGWAWVRTCIGDGDETSNTPAVKEAFTTFESTLSQWRTESTIKSLIRMLRGSNSVIEESSAAIPAVRSGAQLFSPLAQRTPGEDPLLLVCSNKKNTTLLSMLAPHEIDEIVVAAGATLSFGPVVIPGAVSGRKGTTLLGLKKGNSIHRQQSFMKFLTASARSTNRVDCNGLSIAEGSDKVLEVLSSMPVGGVLIATSIDRLSRKSGELQKLKDAAIEQGKDVVVCLSLGDVIAAGGSDFVGSAFGTALPHCPENAPAITTFNAELASYLPLMQLDAVNTPVAAPLSLVYCSETIFKVLETLEANSSLFVGALSKGFHSRVHQSATAARDAGLRIGSLMPDTKDSRGVTVERLNKAVEVVLEAAKAAAPSECEVQVTITKHYGEANGLHAIGSTYWNCNSCKCGPCGPDQGCMCKCKKCLKARDLQCPCIVKPNDSRDAAHIYTLISPCNCEGCKEKSKAVGSLKRDFEHHDGDGDASNVPAAHTLGVTSNKKAKEAPKCRRDGCPNGMRKNVAGFYCSVECYWQHWMATPDMPLQLCNTGCGNIAPTGNGCTCHPCQLAKKKTTRATLSHQCGWIDCGAKLDGNARAFCYCCDEEHARKAGAVDCRNVKDGTCKGIAEGKGPGLTRPGCHLRAGLCPACSDAVDNEGKK